eukprot:4091594-Pyramimonas_sp.AAC.1
MGPPLPARPWWRASGPGCAMQRMEPRRPRERARPGPGQLGAHCHLGSAAAPGRPATIRKRGRCSR